MSSKDNFLDHVKDSPLSLESDRADDFFYSLNATDTDVFIGEESIHGTQNATNVYYNSMDRQPIDAYVRIRQKGNVYYLYMDAFILNPTGPEDYASRLMFWLRSFPKDTNAQIYIYVFHSSLIFRDEIALSENPRAEYFPESLSRLNTFLMTNAYTTFVIDRMINHMESYVALCVNEIVFRPSGILVIVPIHPDEKHLYFQNLFEFHTYLYNRACKKGYLTDEEYQNLIDRKRVVKYSPEIEEASTTLKPDIAEDEAEE